MSRIMLCLCLTGLVFLSLTSADEKPNAPKPNGNRLTYLDEPCNPYYVHRDFPKLTTPMWVGEEGVEAVVILGIDDMRGHEKWETYLRPILNRLKQIDGRAPVSIMTCTIDPKHPHLQQWLEEGLSLEVHTVDHPCPLLQGGSGPNPSPLPPGEGGRRPGEGSNSQKTPEDKANSSADKSKTGSNAAIPSPQPSPQGRGGQATVNSIGLAKAKSTYDRCVDLLNEVPNNKPVCFRMPCCDSLNTLSPRFFTEIFAKTTEGRGTRGEGRGEGGGNFLQADSSVFNVFTSDDPALPRELVLESVSPSNSPLAPNPSPLTRERFKKYIPADRFFANTIENYPYPYVIDRLCWEFPCVTPSDWSAQHLHKPHNPQTVEDWKAALDCTVIKQGVFCLVFHPHNWIKPEQINELIDHAVTKHGKKVKFLNFREAVERLNKNVLDGTPLRDSQSDLSEQAILDVNGDGFFDVVSFRGASGKCRVWHPASQTWKKSLLPFCLVQTPPSSQRSDRRGTLASYPNFGIINSEPSASAVISMGGTPPTVFRFESGWKLRSQITFDESKHSAVGIRSSRARDLDHDGSCEWIIADKDGTNRVFHWSEADKSFIPLKSVSFRLGMQINRHDGSDAGLRFIDLDEDGHDDIVFSNHERYGIWLWESMKTGWSREVVSAKRGDKPAEQELPPIVRADGSNNGFWVHSRHLIWMNEDTAKSKDLVERRSFEELLARGEGRGARGEGKDKTQNTKDKSARPSPLSPQPSANPDGPKSPEESLKLMQVKPGYRVELVAAEPLVRDPVAFDWGPDGKLWVAEMADYPLGVGAGEEADNADAASPKSSRHVPRDEPSKVDSRTLPKTTTTSNDKARHAERDGYKKGGGRVRFLEDTDGDGKYDKSTVFLDRLNFPNGVMSWRDGVLISAAPEVLFARDTNGDGKADEVIILLTGFGEGNQQHRVNGFSWGLDNMVHCANGDSGGTIKVVGTVGWVESSRPTKPSDDKSKDGGSRGSTHPTNHIGKTIDIRGRDFRWNPDTGEFDPTSGQTQFGRNRDDFGNWFGNNNANPMYHFVLDDYYIRRNPHVAPPDPKKQVSITPGPSPVFPISRTLARFNDFAMANRFTSANSAMVYRDDLLFQSSPHVPREEPSKSDSRTSSNASTTSTAKARHAERDGYVAHVFISEPVHNLVHHEVMTADGVTFTSRRADDEQQSEFLASKDNWFRPTQIKTGPDGALYIADMYRQVIEHPQYIPPALQEKLDLRAGHDKGRIYRVVAVPHWTRPNSPPWPLDKATDDELAVALFSPNGTVRDLAHRLLLWRNSKQPVKEEIISLFCEVATKSVYEEPASIEGGLLIKDRIARHSSPLARVHALALLDAFQSQSSASLSKSLQDEHPAVRRRALQAIENFDGELPDPLINQLSGMGRDPDPFVRMQFAYTLVHPKFASLGHELGKLLYREREDKYLVAAAMSSIHAKNVASVVANVFESAGKEPLPPQLASTLLNLSATLGEDQALLSLIEYVLSGAATTESQPVMLATVLETLGRRGTSLSQLKGIAPQRLARAEQQLAKRLEAARVEISNFKSQISDLKSDAPNRKSEILNLKSESVIASLPLLGRQPDQRGEDAKLIGALLVPQAPTPVQTAAVTTLARINHDESVTALLGGWRTFTPALRTQVLDALLGCAAWTDKLLDALEAKSIAPSDIDAARRQRLIAHSNEFIRTRAAKLLESSANADRQKIVAEFAAKLKDGNLAGDATRGGEVFKKRCATCHKLKDIGTSVGADLVALTDKSTTAMLTAILDPNKAVEAKFLAYSAVNKQGQLFSGMIAAETGNSITLMATDGKQHALLRADLDEFISSGKSFMPEGLEKDVSPNELADVIAFVQSSGPPPKKFDGNHPEVVAADANGTLKLLATNAEIYGKTLVFEPQFKNLGYWGSVDDRAVWTINVTKPGKHSIRLNYACDNSTAGNEAVFEVAGQSVRAKIVGTGSWENYQTAILGELDLPAGQHRLTVRAAETLKNHLMDLKEVRLVPE